MFLLTICRHEVGYTAQPLERNGAIVLNSFYQYSAYLPLQHDPIDVSSTVKKYKGKKNLYNFNNNDNEYLPEIDDWKLILQVLAIRRNSILT